MQWNPFQLNDLRASSEGPISPIWEKGDRPKNPFREKGERLKKAKKFREKGEREIILGEGRRGLH